MTISPCKVLYYSIWCQCQYLVLSWSVSLLSKSCLGLCICRHTGGSWYEPAKIHTICMKLHQTLCLSVWDLVFHFTIPTMILSVQNNYRDSMMNHDIHDNFRSLISHVFTFSKVRALNFITSASTSPGGLRDATNNAVGWCWL